jgi:PAS domain S-box-containing protein
MSDAIDRPAADVFDGAAIERDREVEGIIESAWDPIFTVRLDGTVVRVNRACEEQSGYRREELVGRSALEVLTPAGQTAVTGYVARLLTKEPVPRHIEVDLRHKDGSVVPGEAAMRPIYERGRIVVIHCICRILTERRELERRRIAEARLQTAMQLAAGAAHELFQPLTGMVGLIDLLATDARSPAVAEVRRSLARSAASRPACGRSSSA